LPPPPPLPPSSPSSRGLASAVVVPPVASLKTTILFVDVDHFDVLTKMMLVVDDECD
jgi:hypothetical protein